MFFDCPDQLAIRLVLFGLFTLLVLLPSLIADLIEGKIFGKKYKVEAKKIALCKNLLLVFGILIILFWAGTESDGLSLYILMCLPAIAIIAVIYRAAIRQVKRFFEFLKTKRFNKDTKGSAD